MPTFICESCGEDFPLKRGLTSHRRHCKSKTGSASRLRRIKACNAAKRKLELKSQADHLSFPLESQDLATDLYDPEPLALFDTAPLELPIGTKRVRRLPRRFTDHLPSSSSSTVLPTISLPHLLDLVPSRVGPLSTPTSPSIPVLGTEAPRKSVTTLPNKHGIFRVYPDEPEDAPDEYLDLEDLCDAPNLSVQEKIPRQPSLPSLVTNVYAPFKNATTYLVMDWANREVKEKTNEEVNELVHQVILHPNFNREDLINFNARRENSRLDGLGDDPEELTEFSPPDGWREGSVKIKLPPEDSKKHPGGEAKAPEFEVKGINYRPLLETIYKALDDPDTPPFHYTPYREFWKPNQGSPEDRVFGELYSSDFWLKAHEEVQVLPKKDGAQNYVLPIILYSDSTHLANFGTASLWPLYMYLGGQSKYMRSKLTEPICHHLAYIPSLPASIQEAYNEAYGRSASSELLTHLKRETFQAVLSLVLLHPDIRDAYLNGFLFSCTDNVLRRFFPRFAIYSADYPERMLIATLRVLGAFPSPTSFVPGKYIHQLGTTVDKQRRARKRIDNSERQEKISRARKYIFALGKPVESAKVKDPLKDGSLIPIHNAFSVLSEHGFNFHDLFVPDLMHEFELGVWKSIFTHLMRILVAQGGDTVPILNSRYRLIPTFGSSAIRRFTDNTAAMRKLAARDFEDMLQCALPAFEDLLPEKHNKIVLDLLFVLATWHAYAKLRLHTESTVRLLEEATTLLGHQVRLFKKTVCAAYDTRELAKEIAARGRRRAALVQKGRAKPNEKEATGPAKQKLLNINTPKFHAIGGYAETIRRFGTTDSYSTQNGEAQHKRVKRMFGRTNKRNAAKDVSNLEGRGRRLRDIRARIVRIEASTCPDKVKNPSLSFSTSESLPKTTPQNHYHMAASRKYWFYLSSWLEENGDDPALTNFMTDLRAHLLSRILFRNEDEPFTPDEICGLRIKQDRLFRHKVLRINFTTYDLRRSQDSLNPRTHADIMLLSGDTEHPFAYARIIGLFHADIAYTGPGSTFHDLKRFDFAWIRWLRLDTNFCYGFAERRLPRVQFLDCTDVGAFGFIDPELILRGVHLIPHFAQGRTQSFLPHSLVRQASENDEDYLYYYVNIFADRDMFMRYRGGGVGHKITWHVNESLLKDDLTRTDHEQTIEAGSDAEESEERDSEYEKDSEEDGDEGNIGEHLICFGVEDGEDDAGDESEGYACL